MRSTNPLLIATALLAILSLALFLQAAPAPAAAPAGAPAAAPQATQPTRAELEKRFADLLTNAVLTGNYTSGDDKTPKEDKYTILKAVKGEGDDWIITTRIEYKK